MTDESGAEAALRAGIEAFLRGSPSDIELAMVGFEQSVAGFATGSMAHAVAQLNLAMTLAARTQGSERDNIARAIALAESGLEHAAALTTDASVGGDQPEYFRTVLQAASLLASLYLRRVDDERAMNIERAHQLLQTVVDMSRQAQDRDSLAQGLNALALVAVQRMIGDRNAHIEAAIAAYDEALGLVADDPELDATVRLNLVGALLVRRAGTTSDNVERAIETLTTVSRAPLAHATLSNVEINLGFAFLQRVAGPAQWNCEEAGRHFRRAQSLSPAGSADHARTEYGLGGSESAIGDLLNDDARRAGALEHYDRAGRIFAALELERDHAAVLNAVAHVNSQFSILTDERVECALDGFTGAIDYYRRTADAAELHRAFGNMGFLLLRAQEWSRAQVAFFSAIDAGEQMFGASFTDRGRHTTAAGISEMYGAAAYCAVQLGQVGSALELLDRGKARVLAENLAVAGSRAAQGRGEPGSGPAALDWRSAARSEIDDARRIDAAVAAGATWHQLMGLLPRGSALVAPVVSPVGGLVLVIPAGQTPSEEHVVRLPGLTYELLDRWMKPSADGGGWSETYAQARADPSADAQAEWDSVIAETTSRLWTELMSHVADKLAELGLRPGASILLTAPGYLSVLPLHAAWRDTDEGPRPFNADWVVSYIPSAGVHSAITRRSSVRTARNASLLLVSDPTEDLPFARLETETIDETWTGASASLVGVRASRAAVLDSLATATHLHFACHGIFERHEPMASALLLATGDRLTVADILSESDLRNADVVVLSACETGIIDTEIAPSEFLGFPNAFLQAGATSVVSSLWAVDDASTALIMKRFYELLLHEKLSPAESLRRATEWVRTATSRELDMAEWWLAAGRATGDAEALARSVDAVRHPNAIPFASPRFWAAFYVSGQG